MKIDGRSRVWVQPFLNFKEVSAIVLLVII